MKYCIWKRTPAGNNYYWQGAGWTADMNAALVFEGMDAAKAEAMPAQKHSVSNVHIIEWKETK